MRVLCTESPTLLDDLLDGLLWTAQSASTTEAGIIRANYYVRVREGEIEINGES